MKSTIMAQESRQAPSIIEQQLRDNNSLCISLVEQIKNFNPALVYIVGRGSSDHAGVFAKYLIEVELGIPVSSSAPSVFSVFKRTLKLNNALVLIISQSGGSPDIIEQAKAAKASGAMTVALVNTPNSPLSDIVDAEIPIGAGEEKAIAATKSYMATLSALLQLVAYWKGDEMLLKGLLNLPVQLTNTINGSTHLDPSFVSSLRHCVVLGRGFGYAIGREIALKLKEVCGVHAEAFSSAEFLHGPVTLVEKELAVIDINIKDESHAAHNTIIDDIINRGSKTKNITVDGDGVHPRCLPLIVLQRFYLDVEQAALSMGLDPDSPAGLKKVTKTL